MKKSWVAQAFTLTVLLLFIVNMVAPVRVFSKFENRYLAQLPPLNVNQIISNQFSINYETYVNDQFFIRDTWISTKALIERLMMKQENNGIYFGKDGYLFDKMIQYPDQLAINQKYMNEFLALYPQLSISVMIPTNSASLLLDKLPNHAPQLNQYTWLKENAIEWPWIDTFSIFKSSNKPVYYKTDHHWTLYGAFLAYSEWISSIGKTPLNWEEFDVKDVKNFLGTYYSKGKPSVFQFDTLSYINPSIVSYSFANTTVDTLIDESKLSQFDKYSAFLYGNPGFAQIITNESEQPSKVLIIKDSYANSFIPFLTQHFDQIDIVDLRGYSGSIKSLVSSQDYDQILILSSFAQFSSDSNFAKLRY